MRRRALEQAGGMEAFGIYLAEDYFFAYQFVQKCFTFFMTFMYSSLICSGWRCAVASQPAMQNHEPEMRRFFDRMCRCDSLFALDDCELLATDGRDCDRRCYRKLSFLNRCKTAY